MGAKLKLSFRLSEPTLIEGWGEWRAFLLLLFATFVFSLGLRYLFYLDFTSHKKIFTGAEVLVQYTKTKSRREYEVLKLRTDDGRVFYTTSREPLKNLVGRSVSILLFPKKVSFTDYLSVPYIPAAIIRVNHDRSIRERVYEKIRQAHEHPWIQQLYGALYLARPVYGDLREKIGLLGISHLLALSGFHLGLLWLIVYGGLSILYRPIQQRFFPWRHRLLDVGTVTLVFLGVYLVFTGAPPSLVRAYMMVAAGWLALLLGLKIFSFSFLAFCVLILLALFPPLLFSIGFWFSVSGVFFIYQLLYVGSSWPKWALFGLLNLWVYLAMLPVVHSVFGTFSLYQLLSVPLSIIFSLFYPFSIVLHLTGMGNLMDGWILDLLRLPSEAKSVNVSTPVWLLGLFVAFSLIALFRRTALYLQVGFVVLFFLFLVQQIA